MDKNGQNRNRSRNRFNSIDGFIQPKLSQQKDTERMNSRKDFAPTSDLSNVPNKAGTSPANLSNSAQDSILNKSMPGLVSSNNQTDRSLADQAQPKKKRWFRRRNAKKWSWKRRIGTTCALLLVALIAAGVWDLWQLEHKVNHLAVGNLTASVGGAENILVAGSTNRCNLKVQNAQWGFCSQGVTGVNSDVIFIVHVVPKTHTVSLLSIPRDTFVPNARSGDQAFKIDAALYEGPTQLVNAVQEDFGIPIQHYAEVGFDGFVNVVNAVGGIKMNFPMPVYDSESYLNVKTPGCKLLNGVEALQVVRARHLQYDPPSLNTSDVNLWPQETESDIARIARTHEFLRVLASTVAAKGISNPVTDQKLVDAIAPQVQVDSGFSTSAMIQLLQEFHAVNINNVAQYTLPISTTEFGDYIYNNYDYGDVVFPAEAQDQQVINQFLGESNSTDSMTDKPLPTPSSVNVNVVNGSGTPGQAAKATASLQALDFNMVGLPESTTPLSDEAVETVVAYASPSTEAKAETVARQLTGPVILSQNSSLVTRDAEVTVITGTGLSVNSAAGSSSSQSNTSSQTTSSSSSTSSSSALAAPSSATEALSAWDPRACTE